MNAVTRAMCDGRGSWANVLVRLLVGAVFLSEGIQKFLFPQALGAGRFAHIGLPAPHLTAPFVAAVEVGAGALVVLGLFTRLAALLLLADIGVAIATTKLPMLAGKGAWATAHESRTDWAMLLGLLFLLVAGAGALSADARFARRRV